MDTKKIDIEKLPRNTPQYPKEFFNEMQKNVFEEISKKEYLVCYRQKKRRKNMNFVGVAACIAIIMGFFYLDVDSFTVKNAEESSKDFNFYDDFMSNEETSIYTSLGTYASEEYDKILDELSSNELDEEIEKYEIVTYLDYLY